MLKILITKLVVLSVLIIFTGCYYLHIYEGQMQIETGQTPIKYQLENSKKLTQLEKHRLSLILSVKKFAEEEIGLTSDSNYENYYPVKSFAPSFVVMAAYPNKLEYFYRSYPFVGKMPYKGYFYLDAAKVEADKLRVAGFDVIVAPASAYSTLGFFADPVFSSMLTYDEITLTGLIIHEKLHNTVYKTEFTEFNESLAKFYEREGTLLYIEQTLGKDNPVYEHAQKIFSDEDKFVDIIKKLVNNLNSLYETNLPLDEVLTKRQKIFFDAQKEYVEQRKSGYFQTDENDWFAMTELNNARILNLSTYKFNLDLYKKVAEHAGGLKNALHIFNLASESDDPIKFLEAYSTKDIE